ncbi:MAG: hypothetical protein HY816_13360 [Candidatus Wallbacteria bacterium]|nr:hypothetical protein [Candidatus Wallbacteria bacterium]
MIAFPLALRPLDRRAAPAAAWFIPGESAATWLDELATWGVPMAQLVLLVLPALPGDRRPCGVLAVPAAPAAATPSPRALPYRLLAERLYLPADSALHPEVSEEELRLAVSWHALVLHPGLGPVGFRREQLLGVADLLARPRLRSRRWNMALPAPGADLHITSVEPLEKPTLETVFGETRKEIAAKPPSEVPKPDQGPAAEQPGETGKWAGRQMARTVNWLAGRMQGGTGARGWVNELQDWARRKLDQWDSSLEISRHLEIQRLLRLLETNPDEGLKYALPLRGVGSRGVAEPGAKLGRRDADFSLDRLGGGRPADVWSTPWQVRAKLQEAYRKQAERELSLLRHRRAAYIYAELLGDVESAASVLKQGRHFREAAVLYREHLRRPLAAAQCLEDGGLLAEAIGIYEEERQFLKAGMLHEKLGQTGLASRAFRAAVADLGAEGNLVGAAGVLETRLHAPLEALAVLTGGWPSSVQASKCLVERFNLLGRLGRHDEAMRLLPRLWEDTLAPDRVPLLAEALSSVARVYPDRDVRARAADLTRVTAGSRLPQASAGEAVGLIGAITRLAPEDRLLARDALRWVARTQRRAPAAAAPSKARKLELTGELRLSDAADDRWTTAAAGGDFIYAAGYNRARRIVLGRVAAGQPAQRLRWYKPLWSEERLLVAAPRIGAHTALLWLMGGRSPGHLEDHPVRQFPDGQAAGSPAWLPGNTVGFCYGEGDALWLVKRSFGSPPVLCACSPRGDLQKTCELERAPETAATTGADDALPMAAQGQYVFVATIQRLHQVDMEGHQKTLELPGRIRDLAVSPPNSRLRVALVLDEGGVVFWPTRGTQSAVQGTFGERMSRPRVALLADGSLVALTPKEGRLYDVTGTGVRQLASFEGPGDELVAVLPCRRPGELAVVEATGLVRTYRVSKK